MSKEVKHTLVYSEHTIEYNETKNHVKVFSPSGAFLNMLPAGRRTKNGNLGRGITFINSLKK